jgi:hypothetical protein
MEQFINPDNVVALKSDLINLIAGQSLCISAGDFKKLTGDEITEFGSEGRFMMGNLAEGANCTIDTTDGIAIFTKKPVASVWPRSPDRGPVGTSVSDTNMPAKAQLSALIIYPRSQRILLRPKPRWLARRFLRELRSSTALREYRKRQAPANWKDLNQTLPTCCLGPLFVNARAGAAVSQIAAIDDLTPAEHSA